MVMLVPLGFKMFNPVKSLKLMTNNPQKINDFQKYGVVVEERVALQIKDNPFDLDYLKVKQNKMGHLFD